MENTSNGSQGPLEQEAGGDNSVKAVLGCLLWLLVLSTLVGNALVCLAVLRFHHLRAKVTNWFVLSLATSDLCVGLLVMPWRAIADIMGGIWLFGHKFCDTWVAFDIMCSTASILHLCIISLDRYWAIASPFRYERRMTQCLAATMISLAWVLSILISFIPVQLHWHKADREEPLLHRCNTKLNPTYAITSSFISFYIPVLVMIGTYTRIYRIAQAQIRRISSLERAGGLLCVQGKEPAFPLKNSLSRETKVLQTLSIIMGVFVFCWLPFFLLNCLLPFCESRNGDKTPEPVACINQTTLSIFTWLGWANSSVNPVIYAFNTDFRRAFSRLLGCHCFCCWATSTTTIERVNLSNELVSYQQDSSCQKGRSSQPASILLHTVSAWSQTQPHPGNIEGEEETNEGTPQEKQVPQPSEASPHCGMNNRNLPILLPSECEAEVIFERCTHFAVIA